MAVAIDKQGAARRGGIHPDNFIRRRGPVGHHIALFGAEGSGNILFSFQVRATMIEQRPQFRHGYGDVGL